MATKRRRTVLLALLCVLLLAAPFMMALEAHHDCCETDCPVCAHLAALQQVLRGTAPTAGMWLGVAVCLLAAGGLLGRREEEVLSPTPVRLRVKLTD